MAAALKCIVDNEEKHAANFRRRRLSSFEAIAGDRSSLTDHH
jgi:hypothetical protein